MIVEPRDAATVILVRESSRNNFHDFEVLMVLRHPESVFVPGAYVFPGGAVEDDDYSPEMENFCEGISKQNAWNLLDNFSSPERALSVLVAGIRETFEEVGLLMAYRHDGSMVGFDSEDCTKRFRSYSRMLSKGEMKITDILESEELTLAAERLHYFSHWITPEIFPIRYDARFFVAQAPENQEALHDGVEITEHVWITPEDALKRFYNNSFNMILPTVMTIKELSKYKTVSEVVGSTIEKNIMVNTP